MISTRLLKRILPVMAMSIIIPVVLYVWVLPQFAGNYPTYLPLLLVIFAGIDTGTSTFALTEGRPQTRAFYGAVFGLATIAIAATVIMLVVVNTRGS